MMYKIFTTFDRQAGYYMKPFAMRARGEAIRGFADVCNMESHPFFQSPTDYELFELGEFDDSTGRGTYHVQMIPLGKASDFRKTSP